MKYYKSVEFLSIFRMSSPPAETQSPPIENFLVTVLLRAPMVLTNHEFKTVCLSSVQNRTHISHSFRVCMFSNNVDL